MEIILVFFALLFFHYLFDFPLQGEYVARAKSPVEPLPHTPWKHVMAAHCMLHAGGVYIVLGVWWIAALEFIGHFAVDYFKCRGELTYEQDQYLHIMMKALWVVLAVLTASV